MTDEIKPITLSETKVFEPTVVPDTMYKAQVVDLRQFSGQYGEGLAIDFRIQEGDHAGKVVGGICNLTKITKKTKLYKWAIALGAPVPEKTGDAFNPNELMNKEGRILTARKEKTDTSGQKYFDSFVKDLMPKE